MIEPHGGKLIDRCLPKTKAESLKKSDLPRLVCNVDTVLDIEKIAIGAYSPLKGFMGKDDLSSVVTKMRLTDGTPWTIPIFLPINEKEAKKYSKGDEIIIQDETGDDIALMKISEIYSFHRKKWAKNVYGTDSTRHPGVKRLFDMHGKLLAGEVWMIDNPALAFEKFNLFPEETRKIIKERGWKTVSGFQTRNAPHRAHEYLQKLALSLTDGVLIHPIIGWKKDGDFRPEIVIKSYQTLIDKYYPKNSTIFAGLATAMRYAGPREAVFHAIIRKNYGCTHFIVGRDHAGVGDFYDKYDAHRIFDKLPDIGVIPLLMRGPYFCRKCNEIVSDKICPHPEKWHKHISGTMVRESLAKNKPLPEYVMRKEVFTALKRAGKNGFI
ncbi:MAG: sulfate adenylyltransferase [Candidatus Aadella gelida]|nr:sulfate adenylyltransferase [Candidatus Aadella gelida]